MPFIPHVVPAGAASPPPEMGAAASNPFSPYDVALNGVGFMYAFTTDNPLVRETAPFEKQRIDQAESPGEQTLTGWWLKSQESFHGGAGQLQLEPAVPTPVSHIRFDASKNLDVFVPGRVTRLPDTTVVSSDACVQAVGLDVAGSDAVAYLTATGGTVKLLSAVTGTPSTAPFTGVTGVYSIATDGSRVYAATATDVWALTPGSPGAAVKLATYPSAATAGPVLGWVKSRLMLGVNGAVYAVDVSQTGVTLGVSQLLYQHPSTGWVWRCFSTSPTAILAAGDAGGVSTISQFTINEVNGAPTLQYGGDIAELPLGEQVLCLKNTQGTFLGIGTTRGVRVGEFDSFWSRLTYGPLQLLPTDPIIPCNALFDRYGYLYAVGSAYDEGGLLQIDLGTKTDQAGRFAWAANLIAPVKTTTPATVGCVLPVSDRVVFYIPGTGFLLEGVGPGSGREAWLRTSRMRFDTTEPKLFKLGLLKAELADGQVEVTAATDTQSTGLITQGFTTMPTPEFRLPSGPSEWLALTFNISGADTLMRSYQVKALPGTPRQRHIKLVLMIYDMETSRSGQQIRDKLKARDRLSALESLDAAGDEILFEEFTPLGVFSSRVVIESVSFVQIGRPTNTSDLGGSATVLLRTVGT